MLSARGSGSRICREPRVNRALLAIAVVAALHATARAQAPQRAVIDVAAVGAHETLEAIADRVRALETRFAVSVRFGAVDAIDARSILAPRASGDEAFARVWLDLRNPERAVLFIANAGHDRFLVRALPVTDGYGELTRESLATVVESTVDALLAGGEIGVDRAAAERELEAQTGAHVAPEAEREPPPAPPVPQPEPEPEPRDVEAEAASVPRPTSLLLGAGYRLDAVDMGPTALRHGAQLGVAWAPASFETPLGLLLALSAQYFPSFTLGADQPRLAQLGGGARLAAGVTGQAARALFWQAALGAGADVVRVRPRIEESSGLIAAEAFTVLAPYATAFVSGSFRPSAWLDLALCAGVDLSLTGPHFDVQDGDARRAAVSPLRLHPYALVSVGTPLSLGGTR